MRWLLILLILSSTPGCGWRFVKPSPQPTVNCQQPETRPVGDAPLESVRDWAEFGPLWAVETLGILSEERRLRRLEQDCYKDTR